LPGDQRQFQCERHRTGLSYEWYKGGSALLGQTGSSLVLANVSAADAGMYSVVVSGACGNRGDQQREPDGEPERGGGQRAGEPDQLPGDQRHFQCERHRTV